MNDPIPNQLPGRAWLPYASLELPSTAAIVDQLESWLVDALLPLSLSPEFSGKVLSSAQNSVACIPTAASHVRMAIFTPVSQTSPGQTWGFFRTVKNEDGPFGSAVSTHVIGFYLYVEGSARPIYG